MEAKGWDGRGALEGYKWQPGPGWQEQARHRKGAGRMGVVVENKEEWAHLVQKNAHLMWLVEPREALEALSQGVA